MEFNQYSMYSYSANNFTDSRDEKVLIDLHRMKSIKDYNEVKEYVDRVFGKFEEQEKTLDYPNNVRVYIEQKENYIAVAGLKDDKQVFGLQWIYRPVEE